MDRKGADNRTLQTADRSPAAGITPRQELVGKRYVNLLRCSNLTQADTSPEGQKRINDAFATMNGMTYVDDVYAEGVSGSQTFNREDIQELQDLHRTKPFEVALVHDLSRLTRGGIRHGNVVEDTLRKIGVKVVSSTDFIPDGPEGDLIKSAKHYANQLQARSISLAVARGLSQSLARNARPAAGRNPYALDRLYIGPDTKPRMLVRWDGPVQLWIRPDSLETVGQRIKLPRQPRPQNGYKPQRRERRKQPFKGYVKQADEISQLVPGGKDRLETLVWMCTAYDLWKWGYHRIAQNLNDRKVPAPEGGAWNLKTVRSILFNPIYLGVEVRHRWTEALYNKLGPDGPVAVYVDQDQLEQEKRRSVPHIERPKDEWRLVDVPHLKDVLPSPLREVATERIMRQFDPAVPPHPKKGKPLHTGVGRQKHLDSPFLLTNLLHSKQTGHWMRGEVAQKKLVSRTKTYRYYFDGGAAVRAEKGLNIRRIPAEPLEQAVMGVIEQVLADSRDVVERVKAAAVGLAAEPPVEDRQREFLLADQEEISARLRQAYKLLGKAGSEAVGVEMEADQRRLEEVKRQMKSLHRPKTEYEADIEQVAKNVVHQLDHLLQHLHDLPNADMKQLLAGLLDGVQIDLATDELTFTLVLPDWMKAPMPVTPSDGDAVGAVRLGCKWPWSWAAEANGFAAVGGPLPLGNWTCRKPDKRCYACSRRGLAA